MNDLSSPAQAAWPDVVNENFDALPNTVYAYNYATSTGLTWGYFGGRWGGNAVAAGTLALTNAADNYVVANRSTGAISTSTATTNWNATSTYARIYKLTAAGSVVTVVEDHRAGLYGAHGIAVAPGAVGGDVVGPASATDNDIARYDGTTGKLLKAGLSYDTDTTLAANSNTRVPTQAAVKAYADALVAGFDAKRYGAKGDGRMVTDAVTNSTTTVTSATAAFAAGDVGKVVEVTNGTTTSKSTVASVTNATTIVLAGAVSFTATSCTLYIGTDDTVAVQAASDACEAAGGGVVWFPRGIYVINGALQDTSRSNAQLLFPRRHVVNAAPITVLWLGESPPAWQPTVSASTVPVITGGVVLKCTLNTTGGSQPCCIGAWGPSGSALNISSVRASMRNITVRMPVNPVLTAIDLSHCSQCDLDDVSVDAGQYTVSNIPTPTTATSVGVKLPFSSNGAFTRVGTLGIVGFYNAIQIWEHAQISDLGVFGCLNGLLFEAAQYHSSWVGRVDVVHVKYPIVGNGAHCVHIGVVNHERQASGNFTTVNDVYDPSSYLRGSLRWHSVLQGTGIVDTYSVSGAVNIERKHIDYEARVFTLTDGATVTPDCSIAQSFRWTLGGNRTLANPVGPWDGCVINMRVVQDGTGSRTWTPGSKYKFAGGAPLLSTAASAKDFVSCQYDAADDTWNCALTKAMS
jgi:hypothetical protein